MPARRLGSSSGPTLRDIGLINPAPQCEQFQEHLVTLRFQFCHRAPGRFFGDAFYQQRSYLRGQIGTPEVSPPGSHWTREMVEEVFHPAVSPREVERQVWAH